MRDGEFGRDTRAHERVFEAYPQAWRIVTTLSLCLAKIVGKYAAYPDIDPSAFQRMHTALTRGLRRKRPDELGNFSQELRAVASCPVSELLRPRGADDVDARISAIAQVVRSHTGLGDDLFRELLTGVLSWSPPDKQVILDAFVGIILG